LDIVFSIVLDFIGLIGLVSPLFVNEEKRILLFTFYFMDDINKLSSVNQGR